MATLGDIKTTVVKNLKDSSISPTQIVNAINEGNRFVAKKILLPSLESLGVADTVVDEYSLVIPNDWTFMRNMYSCEIEGQDSPKIINSLEHLRRIIPEFEVLKETGTIQYVVPSFATIIYYPIPAEATTLNCRFYKLPTTMAKDTDPVTGIPEGYQEQLLENYALAKLWKQIEDAMESPPKNAPYHRSIFNNFFDELDDKIDSGQSRAEVIRINHFQI